MGTWSRISRRGARRSIPSTQGLRLTLRPAVRSLGLAYIDQNHNGGLERAVELRPADPVINDHLGDAYWRAGRLQEARFQWRRVLLLGPSPELRRTLQRKLAAGLPAAP